MFKYPSFAPCCLESNKNTIRQLHALASFLRLLPELDLEVLMAILLIWFELLVHLFL